MHLCFHLCIYSNTTSFRVSLTGTVLERQATTTAVKKLKLVGAPFKIFKNTAFISGMFNSALEVRQKEFKMGISL